MSDEHSEISGEPARNESLIRGFVAGFVLASVLWFLV